MGIVGEFNIKLQREYQRNFDKCKVLPMLEALSSKLCNNIITNKSNNVDSIPWYIFGIIKELRHDVDIKLLNTTNNWSIDRILWVFENYDGWNSRITKTPNIFLWGGSNIVPSDKLGLGTLLKEFIHGRYIDKSKVQLPITHNYECTILDINNNKEFIIEMSDITIGNIFVKLNKKYEKERYEITKICLKSY